jgi:thiamine pyrophosphate-dependent acetolactate synthase large subunit-like protein
MKRIDCLKILAPEVKDQLVVVTLGVTREEWLMVKTENVNPCVTLSMGIPTPFGLGLALVLPQRKVVVLDSDGSFLFSLNALATLAAQKPKNLLIIIFDNECYESVGGPPSHTAAGVDLAAMAKGAGITDATTVRDLESFRKAVHEGLQQDALCLIVVKIEVWIADVPARYNDAIETRNNFVRYIEETEKVSVLRKSKYQRRDPAAWNSGERTI